MNKEGRSPHSLFPLLFLFSVRVCRPLPFFSFFFFYSIALSLHGPLWASSNGPLWAWCIGLSLLFFGITINCNVKKLRVAKGYVRNLFNSEFGHDGSPIEWLNPTRHKLEGEKTRQ